jgi:DNA repair protein SbcC/Rad50
MLSRLEIKNFQSLARAVIPLGRLTVVTGPTGSGKSAVIRALRLLGFNARGTAYVTTGAGTATVVAGDPDEGWVAGISRSTGRGGDAYRLRAAGDVQTYTKLAGQVPEDVSRVLRLRDINFAAQHDVPYLLGAAGTEVARTLGELTNVSLVLGAAAEAGRRRKEAARELKDAEGRLAELRGQVARFADLPAQRRAIAEAEAALAGLLAADRELGRLQELARHLRRREAELEAARGEVAEAAPPSLDKLEELAGHLAALEGLTDRLRAAQDDAGAAGAAVQGAQDAEARAHQELHDALVAAGECPLCGQKVA